MFIVFCFLFAFFFVSPAFAAQSSALSLPGDQLSLIWGLPFCLMLLSLAILPVVMSKFWHNHFGKISIFWAFCFLIPAIFTFGYHVVLYEVIHIILLDYVPFIILLFALFTVSGGLRLTGDLVATPVLNVGILAFGTIIASIMGTTGAAMLLIRPIIQANAQRKYNVHVVIFFIFLVANVGGSLTPLGDPPLFLGFLKGVNFFWPLENMFVPMLIVSIYLLVLFYVIDYFIDKRYPVEHNWKKEEKDQLSLQGNVNILLLFFIIASVLISGLWKPNISFSIYHTSVELQNLVRDVSLLIIAFLSWRLTCRENRRLNHFTWFPIEEVAKLFVGIFLTIIPVLAILKSGTDGALSGIISLVSDSSQSPDHAMYFWITGILSSFLDNAPTYLVFFNMAGGDAHYLMTAGNTTLLAISCAAVFMGANTYVGNAPNFMVKSIAQERGIAMPSFFGYMLWSFFILLPIFCVISYLFFG